MGGGNLISPFFYTSEVGYFRFKKKNISQQLDSIKPLHGKKKNSVLDGRSAQCKKHRKYKQDCKHKADKFGYINILIHEHVCLYSIHIHTHNTYAQKIPF